jgi:hypothetical protein
MEHSAVVRVPPLDAVQYFRNLEIFSRGTERFSYEATTTQPWLKVSPANATLGNEVNAIIIADVAAAPSGDSLGQVHIVASTGESLDIEVPLTRPPVMPPRDFKGFIEGDRYVAIEAPHSGRPATGGFFVDHDPRLRSHTGWRHFISCHRHE